MKKVLIICLFINSLLSCVDLDMNPLSQGSSENWYSSESELSMSVKRLYATGYWTLDDDAYTDDWTNRTDLTPVNSATINGQSSQVTTLWNTSYSAIAQANTILDNLEKELSHLSFGDTKEDIKTRKLIYEIADQLGIKANE